MDGKKASAEKKELTKNRKDKKEQADYGRVPSRFWYGFFGTGIALPLLRHIFRIKVKTDKKIRDLPGPLVFVGNHPSFIDPVIMAATVKGRPINFVAGEFLFRKPIFGPIITKGGCIPKAQYRNDLRTVRAMIRVLSRGGTLGIFPEGTRFTDGHSNPFDTGLASLVKKTGAGIVIFRSHGAYMTWPRWSESSWRKGRITAEFTDVLPKEKVAEMSVDEIHAFMREKLEYDEYAYFAEHPQEFRSKAIASGVQNVANICPRCEKLNTTAIADAKTEPSLGERAKGKGNLLVCKSCGNKVLMNKRGFFEPAGKEDKCFPDLHQWAVWEQTVYKKMAEDPGFVLTEKVELHLLCGEREFQKVGSGILTVSGGKIIYEGTEAEETVRKEFSISGMKGMLMDFGKFMEVYEPGGKGNRFVPENRQRLYEIQSIVKAMKNQT